MRTGFPRSFPEASSSAPAIARALVHEPELIIADEPTGNLDIETAERVLETLSLSCRQRRTTLIVATHSREVAALADRTVRIRGGRLEVAAP